MDINTIVSIASLLVAVIALIYDVIEDKQKK